MEKYEYPVYYITFADVNKINMLFEFRIDSFSTQTPNTSALIAIPYLVKNYGGKPFFAAHTSLNKICYLR